MLETMKRILRTSDLDLAKMTDRERRTVEDDIMSVIWSLARYLDKAKGIDPNETNQYTTASGTKNHKSYTYRIRKALRYSYP